MNKKSEKERAEDLRDVLLESLEEAPDCQAKKAYTKFLQKKRISIKQAVAAHCYECVGMTTTRGTKCYSKICPLILHSPYCPSRKEAIRNVYVVFPDSGVEITQLLVAIREAANLNDAIKNIEEGRILVNGRIYKKSKEPYKPAGISKNAFSLIVNENSYSIKNSKIHKKAPEEDAYKTIFKK